MDIYYIIEEVKNTIELRYYWEVKSLVHCKGEGAIVTTPSGLVRRIPSIYLDAWHSNYKLTKITKKRYNYLKGLYLL